MAHSHVYAKAKSVRAHEQKCHNLSNAELRKRCYKRASWIAKHTRLNKDLAAKKRKATDDAVGKYNAQGPGQAVRLPASRHVRPVCLMDRLGPSP